MIVWTCPTCGQEGEGAASAVEHERNADRLAGEAQQILAEVAQNAETERARVRAKVVQVEGGRKGMWWRQ